MVNEENGLSQSDWQTLWQQHSSWLRTVLRARLRDGLIAEEALQDVAVIAWRKRSQLVDADKMAPWLYRIAIRQVQAFFRQRGRDQSRYRYLEPSMDVVDQEQVDPLTWMTSREVHTQVRAALQKLNNQDREILMLKHTEGWTYQQIADHLGVSLDKIIYRLGRARQRLRSLIANPN